MMMEMFGNSYLFGGNAPFVEELYEKYLDNPASVPDEWRDYFDKLAQMPGYVSRDVPHAPVLAAFADLGKQSHQRPSGAQVDEKKQVAALQLINAYRFLGNRWAQLDPLKRHERPDLQELEPAHYGFTEGDLNKAFNSGSFAAVGDQATLKDILDAAKETYCSSVGVEYMHLTTTQEKRWIQARLEPIRSKGQYSPERKKHLLERLTAAETLERYLHTRYVGQKRFSLEGGDSLIVAMEKEKKRKK